MTGDNAVVLLTRIKVIATREDDYAVRPSRNAQRDMDNLGYDLVDVCDCLCDLEIGDVRKVEPADWGDGEVVVCITRFSCGAGQTDELYVKVCVGADSLEVLSFKLNGSPR